MIFTRENIERIRRGTKTETRRRWKTPHAKVGGVYQLRESRFARIDPRDPQIRVVALTREPLGKITAAAVRREGCANLRDFRSQWTRLHKGWDPREVVYVVRFEVLRE